MQTSGELLQGRVNDWESRCEHTPDGSKIRREGNTERSSLEDADEPITGLINWLLMGPIKTWSLELNIDPHPSHPSHPSQSAHWDASSSHFQRQESVSNHITLNNSEWNWFIPHKCTGIFNCYYCRLRKGTIKHLKAAAIPTRQGCKHRTHTGSEQICLIGSKWIS